MSQDGPTAGYDLKSIFNADVIDEIGSKIKSVHPEFDRDAFSSYALEGLEGMELKARSQHICDAMACYLPAEFARAISIIIQSLGEDDGSGGLEGMGSFRYLPFLDFVAARGLADPKLALESLEQMTLHFSGEFSIRPFILDYPDLVLPRMLIWSQHKDWRVRRLASEGSRPRLPWGLRLAPFVQDPAPIIPILDALHADENLTVRRSVANSLNDISKDNPGVAVEVAARWWETGTQDARWTVRHGLRSLIKQGDQGALAVLGYAGGQHVTLNEFELSPQQPKIGAVSEFSFKLTSREPEARRLIVDFALHRMMAKGKTGRKVFKLTEVDMAPGASLTLSGKQAFKQLSTRTYFPGPHAIEVLANGYSLGIHHFEVDPAD